LFFSEAPLRRTPHVVGLSAIGLGLILVTALVIGPLARGSRAWVGNDIRATGSAPLLRHAGLHLPLCEAHLNGHGPYRLLLDSGAGDLLVVRADVADEIGLKASGKGEVYGLGGSAQLSFGAITSLQIGSIECGRVRTGFGPVEASPLLMLMDGVLGLGVFAKGRVTLDLADERIVLEESSGSPGAGTALDVRVTMTKHVVTDVRPGGHAAVAMLDTGAQSGVISPRWMKRHFPQREVINTHLSLFGFGDEARTMDAIAVGVLELAGRRADFAAVASSDLDTGIGSALDGPLDAIIGMNWLGQARTITVDYPAQRAWIEWIEER
jgi:hypothetical protein